MGYGDLNDLFPDCQPLLPAEPNPGDQGKSPGFPNTYPLPPLGGSVFQPAFDDQIQLRYW